MVAQFDASRLTEANGSVLHYWQDASGAGRDLDQSRGAPQVLISDLSDNKKIVRFDGRSQLYSSFDFGSLLGDYSIFAITRHAGGENESVISSVGSTYSEFGVFLSLLTTLPYRACSPAVKETSLTVG